MLSVPVKGDAAAFNTAGYPLLAPIEALLILPFPANDSNEIDRKKADKVK